MADAFIANHTAADVSVPLLEECPICLDNYSHEICVRITGVAGCNHRIGLTCLTALLKSHPELEKKCPLCRAVWIARPISVPRRRANAIRVGARGPGVVFGGVYNEAYANGNLRQPGPDYAARANPIGQSLQGPERMVGLQQHELINLDSSDEDEDYETQVENFNAFTREIENIRSRARNTQFPRHVRGQGLTRQQSTRGTADQPTEPGGAIGGSGVGRFLGRGLNPFRPMTHDPSMRERNNDFVRRREARQASVEARRVDSNAPRLSLELMRVGPIDSIRTPSPPSNEDAMDVIELPANEVQQGRDAVRARQLDQREAELSAREQRLIEGTLQVEQREKVLRVREQRCNERETALSQREKNARLSEQSVAQVVQTVQRQRDEVEALVRRQREELDGSIQ
jgi:hypothetical protein